MEVKSKSIFTNQPTSSLTALTDLISFWGKNEMQKEFTNLTIIPKISLFTFCVVFVKILLGMLQQMRILAKMLMKREGEIN